MAGVDSILKIALEHDADELRLGTDKQPAISRAGKPLRLSIPETTDETLRYLLGSLLDNEAELRAKGKLEQAYRSAEGTEFQVTITQKGAGLEAVFRRGAKKAAASPNAPSPFSPNAPSPFSPIAPSPFSPNAPPAFSPNAPSPPSTPSLFSPNAPTAYSPPPNPPNPSSAPAAIAETRPPVHETRPRINRSERAAPAHPAAGDALTDELRALVVRAAQLRASDLHLADGAPPTVRVDGALRTLDGPPVDVAALLGAQLGEAERAALAEGRSVDAALTALETRFRLNLYRASSGFAAALRLLPPTAPRLADLRLPVPLDDLIDQPHGLILICGATGSGKSATLAALANEALGRHEPLLITLEDPIEYLLQPPPGSHALVRQRQIGRDARDFPTALRDALREDPDLLLIGEMRDAETIGLALTAAETGHLVLASLHSRSASSAIERIVDAYAPARQQQIRVQLADSLAAVVSQRLLPRARGAGRLPAVEVMRRNHSVANLIREGKTAQLATAIQSGRKEGMLPLESCLAELVRTGQVTAVAARAAANDANALATYLQG